MKSVIKRKVRFSATTMECLVIVLRWLCMGLFLYTAYAKAADHARFFNGLKRVHIISSFSAFISFAVPVAEFLVALLLLVPQTARLGLYSFTAMMSLFTVYIISAMIWEKNLPCHCGGAIEKLSWTQHIWFNLAFIAIAIVALRINKLINHKN